MNINEEGQDIVRRYEGKSLKAYLCPAGVLSIGFGHTGPDVRKGMEITDEEAELLLLKDLRKFESCVRRALRVGVNENQFSALVCLAFNIGCDAFWRSTLRAFVNRRDFLAAADEFPRWNKSKGKVLAGLTARRKEERSLFMKPVIVADNGVVNQLKGV